MSAHPRESQRPQAESAVVPAADLVRSPQPAGTLGRAGLGLVVFVYLAIGTLYAVNTPAWQVPDEPAHYNYIRHIAQTGTLPVLQAGDYDQAYLERLKAERFPPDLPIDSVRYESYQPPLYYLAAVPIYLLLQGALVPIRLWSLVLGAGVILFAFLTARALFPAQPVVALTAAGFVAFIPQRIAMMAGVNSDSLAELLMAAGLWLIIQGAPPGRQAWRWHLTLGLIVGAAFLTKVTIYALAPVAAFAVCLRWQRQRAAVTGWADVRPLIATLALIFIPALLLGALYWGRNVSVYGWPDFLGAARHDAVVLGQPRTGEWVAAHGAAEVGRRLALTTFRSFWGQFGWMGVVMDERVYSLLGVYSGLLLAGLAIAAARRPVWTSAQREGLALLAVSGSITVALYLIYNLSFVQHQGRYLFPALVPFGLGAALSLQAWSALAGAAFRRDLAWVIASLVLLGMAALDVLALYRFIIPALATTA